MKVNIPERLKNFHDDGQWKAKDWYYTSRLIKEYPKLASRLRLKLNTPRLGAGCMAAAFGTSRTRVIKVTSDPNDGWLNFYLSLQNRKIPHLVRVYATYKVQVQGMTLYVIRSERLHTRGDSVRGYHAWDVKWPFDLNKTEVTSVFRKAFGKAGLTDSCLKDCGLHNLMFDHLNRPTWYDFSHYTSHLARKVRKNLKAEGLIMPYWDPERNDMVYHKEAA